MEYFSDSTSISDKDLVQVANAECSGDVGDCDPRTGYSFCSSQGMYHAALQNLQLGRKKSF